MSAPGLAREPAHGDTDVRHGPWRHLTLIHRSRPFLVRRGLDLGWKRRADEQAREEKGKRVSLAGIYLHEIVGPDPGLDMHDHPWAFVALILRGGYSEQHAEARTPEVPQNRTWRRWSIHRMRQTDVHRITEVEPGTLTLVLRGWKTRSWGFYLPDRWVHQADYDYRTRRPVSEVRR